MHSSSMELPLRRCLFSPCLRYCFEGETGFSPASKASPELPSTLPKPE